MYTSFANLLNRLHRLERAAHRIGNAADLHCVTNAVKRRHFALQRVIKRMLRPCAKRQHNGIARQFQFLFGFCIL